jgi:hypothetical protein
MTGLRHGLSIGACVRPIPGEREPGDAFAQFPWRRGTVVAIADGVGHGPRAAEAARAFLESVQKNADASFPEMFSIAHRDLLRTRGVVAAVARIDEECAGAEIGGIGNIRAVVLRAGGRISSFIMVPGMLGSSFRTVRAQAAAMAAGDTLVMHSDGVRSGFDLEPLLRMTPLAGSEHVVKQAGKPTDDAACVVVRAS